MTPDHGIIRLGTRGSALALAQTDLVVRALSRLHPEIQAVPVVITTTGDVDKTSPLSQIGGRGVFTSALEDALRAGAIDAAVHSAKDLPSETPADLRLAAFLHREDPRDVFISRHGRRLADLPPNPTIATSSRRRAAQVLFARPDARVVDLRGNVDTRLRKAVETEIDGIVIAAAGVGRMGWHDRITEYLPLDTFVPAPGQGALAIETRADETGPARLLSDLDEPNVSAGVCVERAFLRAIGAGCSMPVGAHATVAGEKMHIRAMVAGEDLTRVQFASETFSRSTAETGASALAWRMVRTVGAAPPYPGMGRNGHVRPLAGLRVLVTRSANDLDELDRLLRDAGAEPIGLPTIRIEPSADAAALDAAIDRICAGHYRWVVFTSRNAVDRVLTRFEDRAVPAGKLGAASIAAVGRATAARLSSAGIAVDLVPQRFTAEDVVAAMVEHGVESARVIFFHGDLARMTIRDGLAAHGAYVDTVEVYQTSPVTEISDEAVSRLRSGDVHAVTLMSPSSAQNLAALMRERQIAMPGAAVACIGPVTASAAREAGLRVDVVATESTAAGLVAALSEWRCRGKGRS